MSNLSSNIIHLKSLYLTHGNNGYASTCIFCACHLLPSSLCPTPFPPPPSSLPPPPSSLPPPPSSLPPSLPPSSSLLLPPPSPLLPPYLPTSLLSPQPECPWQLLRCRNKVVQGTWEEEGAFQVSLRDRALPEDPLHLPLFSDILPYHCVPHMYVL